MNLREHLRERNCPVCGSGDRSAVLHPANFTEANLDEFAFSSRKIPELMHLDLVRCPACALVYASPAFTPEFLSGAYGGAAYDSNDEAYFAARTYLDHIPSTPRRSSALEVGTGNGAFLIELKKAGFEHVCGVEPSSAAYQTAQPEIREFIRPGMFRAGDFAPGSLDLLACFQTMEHLEDPRELCASALQLLKPGGAIYLITHDYDSWVTRLLGRKSPIFDVEHLQLFSKSSLRYLLESCGFERVEMRTIRNRYPLSYWFRLAPMPNAVKRMFIGLLNATRIGRIPLSLNIGNLAVTGYNRSGASDQPIRAQTFSHSRTNMVDRQSESWRPPFHAFGECGFQAVMGAVRRFLDLQSGSIWRDVSAELQDVRGTALDVGCGAQPFRQLFHRSVRYIGIDTIDAKAHFNYELPDTVYYDGHGWPVENGSVDFILCTEALEHVYDTRRFLAEARRCLDRGGRALFTVPFAARWHYIPFDYWRFTPSALNGMLTEAGFHSVAVYARGNAITVACYKVMALMVPLLFPQGKGRITGLMLRLIGVFFAPLFLLLAACGNLSLRGRGGDDCLGYTVLAEGDERQ